MASTTSPDFKRHRYPHCVVWTPLPIITWIFPFIGHMGICTSAGIIRDFAGPYTVSEDNMGFGNPTMYWQLNPTKAEASSWDSAVRQASDEYSQRMHNLFCDNCHSHVACSLNLMRYNGSNSWNMFKLAFFMFFRGKFVGVSGFLKTWVPFFVLVAIVVVAVTIGTVVHQTAT